MHEQLFTHWRTVALILIALPTLIILPAGVVAQEEDDNTCPSMVGAALEAVGDACGGLGRGEACYGHTRVDATFWEVRDELVFSTPADVVPLLDLQRVVTAPLGLDDGQWGVAVLNVQPGSLALAPGQAITFLLMGDATLANEVSPDDLPAPVTPVMAMTNTRSNLRSDPTTATNAISTVDAGTELTLVGVNAAGDWYQVQLDTGRAWIWGQLIDADADALTALPVADTPLPYGPMQAFYFTAGTGTPACQEAPNALVVQSPQDVEVSFNINGMEVTVGSAVVFTMIEMVPEDKPLPSLVTILIEGRASATIEDKTVFELTMPGEAVAITLNDEGRIDTESAVVPPPVDEVAPIIENACTNAARAGVFGDLSCEVEVAAYEPISVDRAPASSTGLEDISPKDVCTIAPINTVDLRDGPGAIYAIQGQLVPGQTINPDGYATGVDGFRWWRLSNGTWLRGDLVNMAGACAGIPTVEAPPFPAESLPSGVGGAPTHAPTAADLWWCMDVYGGHTTIAAGQTIHWTIGVGIGDDPERAPEVRANTTAWLNVNGTPATFLGYWAYYESADLYYSGPAGDPDGPPSYGFHAVFEFGPLEPADYVVEGGITTYGETVSGTCIAHAQ